MSGEVFLDPLSGQSLILRVVCAPKDGLAHVGGLALTGFANKFFELALSLRWQTHGDHRFAS
jgi:hypothetical protein